MGWAHYFFLLDKWISITFEMTTYLLNFIINYNKSYQSAI